MYTFVFNPSTNRESLRDFNERVAETCLEESAIQIVPQSVGGMLILNVWTPQDVESVPDGTPTLLASVLPINGKDADVEEQLDKLQEREARKATEEDPVREPTNIIMLPNHAVSVNGWAVVLVVTGELAEGEDDDEEDDEDDGDSPVPSFTPEVIPPERS